MLKITIEHNNPTATFKLAGKLAGPWVDELDRAWREVSVNERGDSVLLDLCDVTFVAPEGREQLTRMYARGATFKTSGCFGKGLVDDIVRDCGSKTRA